ncbi:MAG: hypothetical protein QXK88_05195 [Desulfurococcaceae archaeon]
MLNNKNVEKFIAYVAFSAAVIILFSFTMNSSLSKSNLAIELARHANSYQELCALVSYMGPCSSIFLYIWALSRIPNYALVVIQFLTLPFIYGISSRLLGSRIVGAMVSLIYATSPVMLAPSSLDQLGLVFSTQLLIVPSLLLIHVFENQKIDIARIVLLALYSVFVLHPVAPILLLLYSIDFSVKFILQKDSLIEKITLAAMALLLSTAILAFGLSGYAVYTLPALSVSVGMLLVSIAIGRLNVRASLPYRLIQTLMIYSTFPLLGVLSYASGTSYAEYVEFKQNPVTLYGAPGLLALPGIVLALRSPSKLQDKYVAVCTLFLIPLSAFSRTTLPLALVYAALASGIFLRNFEELIKGYTTSLGSRRNLYVAVVAGALGLMTLSSCLMPVNTHMTPLLKEVEKFREERNLSFTLSVAPFSLEEAIGGAIKSSKSGGSALIVSRWDYSLQLAGILASEGIKAYNLASTFSNKQSQSLYSMVMTSSWKAAYLTLKNISSHLGVEDVYVLVSFAYSLYYLNYSHLGIPILMNIGTSQYPTVVFEAYGDIGYMPLYLELAGRTKEDYLQGLLGVYTSPRLLALTWTSTGKETLISQLCIKGLQDYGYSAVFNYMAESSPLRSEIEGFQLVHAEIIPLTKIDTLYYGGFDVYYMVALFKLL